MVQNAAPFTFFQSRRIDVAEGATPDGGTLSAALLRRASPVDMPSVIWRAFSRRSRLSRHRQISAFERLDRLVVSSEDERPLPLQVDGDFIGDVHRAEFGIRAPPVSGSWAVGGVTVWWRLAALD